MQVQSRVDTEHELSTGLQDKMAASLGNSCRAWDEHTSSLQRLVDEHKTSASASVDAHYALTAGMKSDYDATIDSLSHTLATNQAEFVANTSANSKQLAARLDHATDWSSASLGELSDRAHDVHAFLTSDMQTDVATGRTPRRVTVTYPATLTKMEPHDVLLENFRPANLSGALEDLSEGENGDEAVFSVPPPPPPPATDADRDDVVSEVGSCSSHTSGISGMSDLSAVSSCVSKKSQKENKTTARRPAPAPVKKSKFTNVNITRAARRSSRYAATTQTTPSPTESYYYYSILE
jgi:hypothetical protein